MPTADSVHEAEAWASFASAVAASSKAGKQLRIVAADGSLREAGDEEAEVEKLH